MAGSVTEAQSLDKGRGGRNVTGVHGSVTGVHGSVTGVHGSVTGVQGSVTGIKQKCVW